LLYEICQTPSLISPTSIGRFIPMEGIEILMGSSPFSVVWATVMGLVKERMRI
jgi:hypothetical protein